MTLADNLLRVTVKTTPANEVHVLSNLPTLLLNHIQHPAARIILRIRDIRRKTRITQKETLVKA